MSSLVAYVDPGTGSMLLQLFLGGTAAVAVFGRLMWTRIKSMFRRGSDQKHS